MEDLLKENFINLFHDCSPTVCIRNIASTSSGLYRPRYSDKISIGWASLFLQRFIFLHHYEGNFKRLFGRKVSANKA